MISRIQLTLVAATCLVALTACPKDPKERTGEGLTVSGRTIRLGDILFTTGGQGSRSNYYQVQGSFKLALPKAGEKSIPTEGHGGACLLQQQNTLCSGAQDPDKGAAECSPPTGGWGYCLDKRHFEPGVIRGQCWIKGPNDCLRAPRENDGKLLVDGQTYQVPKTWVSVRRPAKVRLIACLNGIQSTWPTNPDGTKRPPCTLPASNDRIDIVGPAKALPSP